MVYRVLIENLPEDKTVEDVKRLFQDFGPLAWIFIEIDEERKKPWGFTYVALENEAKAEAAVATINAPGADGEPLRLRGVELGPDIYVDKSPLLNSPPEYIYTHYALIIESVPPGSTIQLDNIPKGVADAQGRAHIDRVMPGKYLLTVFSNQALISSQQITVSDSSVTRIVPANRTGAMPMKEMMSTGKARPRFRWIALAVAIALPLIILLFHGTPGSQPVVPPPPPPPEPPPGMVYVPAGRFVMGRYNSSDEYESPAHVVEIKRHYFIDKTEVTNGDYAKFVAATGRKPPKHWNGSTPPDKILRLPVVFVSWYDALEYCKWRSSSAGLCRLPSESEWEMAARGTDSRLYPWGNDWRDGIANANNRSGAIMASGSMPSGASPYGALDMVGNVWEWTADDMKVYPLSKASPQPNVKVVRGGAYDSDASQATGTFRGFVPYAKNEVYDRTGFRCLCEPQR